jgi:hypothetical protein
VSAALVNAEARIEAGVVALVAMAMDDDGWEPSNELICSIIRLVDRAGLDLAVVRHENTVSLEPEVLGEWVAAKACGRARGVVALERAATWLRSSL